MTVCLVLQGDSASPGARGRMCSGFPYWRRSTPSTHAGGGGAGPGGLGAWEAHLLALGCSILVSS